MIKERYESTGESFLLTVLRGLSEARKKGLIDSKAQDYSEYQHHFERVIHTCKTHVA